MKNRDVFHCISLLFVSIVISVAASAQQQGTMPTENPPASKPDQAPQPPREPAGTAVHGAIVSIDRAANKATVQTDDNKEAELALDPNVTVKIGEKAATVSDLQAGQHATFTMEGHKVVAITVAEAAPETNTKQ